VSGERLDELGPRLELLSGLDLLDGADPAATEAIARAMQPVHFAAGAVMLGEGDPAEDLLLIADGTCVALSGPDATELRRLEAPAYVGEIGLLQRRPRTATVRAVTDVAAFRVPGPEFLDAIGVAGPSRALESRVAERMAASHL
jgi:CRP-like cAMP-binding protein